MKKYTGFLMATIICFAMSPILVFGQSFDNNKMEFEVTADEIHEATEVSFEQAVENRAIAEQLSYDEALNLMIQEEENLINELAEKMYQENSALTRNLGNNKKEDINKIKSELLVADTIKYVNVSKTFTQIVA